MPTRRKRVLESGITLAVMKHSMPAAWGIASMMITPGMTDARRKWPGKYGSVVVTFSRADAVPDGNSSTRSMSRTGNGRQALQDGLQVELQRLSHDPLPAGTSGPWHVQGAHRVSSNPLRLKPQPARARRCFFDRQGAGIYARSRDRVREPPKAGMTTRRRW